jgi:DNA helicase-2/ATP-dependent DNA helicase PcrA
MTVQHPQYGAGTIIALSGDGPKRTATVRFLSTGEERKFRLLFSDLTPAEP